MPSKTVDSGRAQRLDKFFWAFVNGRKEVLSAHDGQLFLEAARSRPDAVSCLETLVANEAGLKSVERSVKMDLGSRFICSIVLPFLSFMAGPEVKAIYEGKLFQRLLKSIITPPTFWNALLGLYLENYFLNPAADAEIFAWLCLEIVSDPGPTLDAVAAGLASALAQSPLLRSSNAKVREYGYRIEKITKLKDTSTTPKEAETPGGRHDNDFANFRHTAVYPTTDELSSTLKPFYRRAAEVANADSSLRPGIHLDNQFRLLREDMLAELREDLQLVGKKKQGKRSAQVLGKLELKDLDTGDMNRGRCSALRVAIGTGLEVLRNQTCEQRKGFLKDNKNILRHQSFGVLCLNNEIICFGFVVRDIELLCQDPPVVGLQFTSSDALTKATAALVELDGVQFVLVPTPVFAYEPVLERLKEMSELPFDSQLLDLPGPENEFHPSEATSRTIQQCLDINATEGPLKVGKKSYHLEQSQRKALVYALSSPVSVIQGPPGTGKSFIGALAAKILSQPSTTLLCISFTNHALDQFLEDILKAGVDRSTVVRLGSKSSDATAGLSFDVLSKQSEVRRRKEASSLLYTQKRDLQELRDEVNSAFHKATRPGVSLTDILQYLEFEESQFWTAFQVPSHDDGFTFAGKHGKGLRSDHILANWARGQNPGQFAQVLAPESARVWAIRPAARRQHMDRWVEKIRGENMDAFRDSVGHLDQSQEAIEAIFNEAKCDYIKTMRVIGCTTTAAAKYSHLIKAAKPDIVLVEEAGEIQEAHVLTALHPETKQLILIGDHKQLRPKINNYALSVERGDGYDLNRSLFERLILQGHPVVTLRKQHRMVPEISQLVRSMTYPDLLDAKSVHDRPEIRGLTCRFTFINHSKPEADDAKIRDRRDVDPKGSKSNEYEARMVLKLVKYLGQQGYTTENIVVLTPYLGQLRLLRDKLSAENDPWLNDLDNFELIRAGVMTTAASKVNKGRIRLSTIDNYQGEESDIVIASLTRSNNKGDIGFMKAPERLNVLLSRARNCLIMVGNMETFMASVLGRDVWVPFFNLLKAKEFLQDGLLVRCEQHPDRTAVISRPEEFDTTCPDGGCADPCSAKLKCGLHKCQRRCHRLVDHGSILCNERVKKTCDEKGHKYSIPCHERNTRCPDCVREEEDIRRRAQLHLDLEKKRRALEAAYRRELQLIQDEIDHEKRLAQDVIDEENRKKALEKGKSELDTLKRTRTRQEAAKLAQESAKRAPESKAAADKTSGESSGSPTPQSIVPGSAQDHWEYQKREEHAQSEALDTLMGMIGLEDVKRAFLNIKATVDTATRQGISPQNQRYGCTFLGNPGTGKTTVARIYAKFLTSMGVIPGNCFEETTGAKLASKGVAGCQQLIDNILQNDGGVLFIDEAYQLTSGNNPGGAAVLDFLLAEVENLRGKLVCVLAGYSKQMEPFFAHNPGLPSRFPTELKFADYTDDELLSILESNIHKEWSGRMKVEDGMRGLFCRIVSRRIGAGRGKDGFGNARAVENAFSHIRRRQAERLTRERRARLKPDDLLLSKVDLIGPEPSDALLKSEAWQKLQSMVGLGSVKESLKALVDSIKANYQRELKEEPLLQYSLNKVFLGNPGTGKTTVAKLYGQILVDLGMLSNGEVVVTNPSDFVAAVIGGSQQQTKGILAATVGKVLVIDEAYGLSGGGAKQGGGTTDPFKTDVVDTIVAEVQSVPGDDRCVLLLGYKDQMEEMFQNVNPGLSRRFPLASAFSFEDFDQAELDKILDLKLRQQGFAITREAKKVVLEMLDRARNRPHFGNAGEIDILLNDAKSQHQKRLSAGKTKEVSTLEPLDFDENFDRSSRSETNIAKLFEGTVGCEKIVATLRSYQEAARTARQLNMDPKEDVPFNFLFRGPPGTGKTTTARKMGKVFYDAGFLSSADVIDCSASDLVGQYVGQTGPKVRQLLDKALGRVLLIDEAYRLAEGQFGKEALDELVDATTKERYHMRLIVILAGYEGDINRLLSVNPGLTSRFPEVIDFHSLTPQECFSLLTTSLKKKKISVDQGKKGTLDMTCLNNPGAHFLAESVAAFEKLSQQASWANARDIELLARSIFTNCKASHKTLPGGSIVISITEDAVRAEMDKMHRERKNRAEKVSSLPRDIRQGQAMAPVNVAQPPPRQLTTTAAAGAKSQSNPEDDETPSPQTPQTNQVVRPTKATRDAGVSDEVWEQLQKDADAEAEKEREYERKQKEKMETADKALRDRIIKELIAEEECRRRQAEQRKKLETRGLCPAGYHWIQQAGGYRCAGGSHFVSDAQLSLL